MAVALAVFVIVQTIEGWLLTPRIMGEQTGLHPVAIIFAVFFWGQAFGGILLARAMASPETRDKLLHSLVAWTGWSDYWASLPRVHTGAVTMNNERVWTWADARAELRRDRAQVHDRAAVEQRDPRPLEERRGARELRLQPHEPGRAPQQRDVHVEPAAHDMSRLHRGRRILKKTLAEDTLS